MPADTPQSVGIFSCYDTGMKIKPFVKWVGGKQRMAKMLEKRLPVDIKEMCYNEPFLGGGAFYAHLWNEGYFHGRKDDFHICLSDINKKLIDVYKTIRYSAEQLNEYLKAAQEKEDTKEYYLKIRKVFNDKKEYERSDADLIQSTRFIYLNKRGFNGLYRENSQGEFNVAYGHGNNKNLYDPTNILLWQGALYRGNIGLLNESYTWSMDNYSYETKDFFFIDPPYDETYNQYNDNVFDEKHQRNLCNMCKNIRDHGDLFMQTNKDTPLIRKLYEDFFIEEVETSSTVQPNAADKRKDVIITNYKTYEGKNRPLIG